MLGNANALNPTYNPPKLTLLGTEYTESELGEMSVVFNPPKLMTQTTNGLCH